VAVHACCHGRADGIAGALSLRAGARSAEQARTTGLALLLSSAKRLLFALPGSK
jgi:hypothetical protein